MPSVYTVVSGDNLSRIAKKFGTTVDELQRLNKLTNANLIHVNQRLLVPDVYVAPPGPAPIELGGGSLDPARARIEAYARTRAIGGPVDNGGGSAVHVWHGLAVQDYAGGPDTEGRCMVVDGPAGAHLVRNGFRQAFLSNGLHLKLGAPLEDEHAAGGEVVQRFEHGTLRWSPGTGVRTELAVAPPAPVAPTPPLGPAGSVYGPLQIAPGATVPSRLGAHWFSTTADGDAGRAQAVIDRMKALGVGYVTLLADPGNPEAMRPVIERLRANGIEPVVRLYTPTPPDGWDEGELQRQANAAKSLSAMGVKLIQIGNEPNIEGNLTARGITDPAARQQYLDRSCDALARCMLAVRRACGDAVKIGATPMACGAPDSADLGSHSPRTFFNRLMASVKGVEASSGLKVVDWLSVHTYRFPPGPTDAAGRDFGPRSELGEGPSSVGWYEAAARAALGRTLRGLSTEGGAAPQDFQGPSANGANVAARMQESLGQLRSGATATDCLWLLTGDAWQHHALWDGEGAFASALEAYRAAYAAR